MSKKQREDLFEILTKTGALATLCEDMSEKEYCINLNAINCKFCPISGEKNLKETLGIE